MQAYTIHITLYDAAFFAMLFIGLTFVLLLWFGRKDTRVANRFLAAALGVGTLWIARLLINDINLSAYAPVLNWLPLQFSLALGPLIYFYVRKITRPRDKFETGDLLHFAPALLELSAQVLQLKAGMAMHAFAFISVIIYLFLCRKRIEAFYRQQKFTDGDRRRQQLQWLNKQLTAFGTLWLLWAPFVLVDYFYYDLRLVPQSYFPLYLLLMAMLIWLAVQAFLRQETEASAEAATLKPLLPAELKQKGTLLKRAVKDNRYYEDAGLSLASLAEKLGMHTHELSRILNTVLRKSFTDFINEYRVQAAARKMQDAAYDHLTLLGIAYESGFNSQSSFNRIFKQFTGKSPQEYKNEVKKEQPSYKMGNSAGFAPLILRPETTSKWSPKKLNRNLMFKNYFKIAWRNLKRNKSYTAINITGLAVGIAVCLVIFIIIQYQTSFDNFHTKKDRIYRVLTQNYHSQTATVSYSKDIAFPIPKGLKAEFPQIEQIAPIFASQNDHLFILDDNGHPQKIFKEQRGLFITSPAFFKIFDFPLLAGSYESLSEPNNVFLTKETAEKYFGDWKLAMGKTIKLQVGGYMFEHGEDVVKVSGVLASIPANSDFQLKVVVSYGTGFTGEYLAQNTDWDGTVIDYGCYVLMPPNTSAKAFNNQLKAFSQKVESPNNRDSHIIEPLGDVHYDTQTGNYSNKTISRDLLNVLWLIAAFILLIACVNFVNLSTAQAVNRAKEVGVRKVLGSSRPQLQMQFLAETFLIVVSAVVLTVIVTLVGLPYVGKLLELSLSFNIFSNPAIICFLLAVIVIVTALAGFYPSIVLSRFNPVNALKSKLSAGPANGISLRRGLVVFQFIIAQALIIGTFIIVRQMDYFMNQPLGFDKEAVINAPFRIDSASMSKMEYVKNRLLSLNNVKSVTFSSNTPIENGDDTWSALKFDHSQKDAGFKAITKFADDAYLRTYKLKLVAGRDLKRSNFTQEFLVNEALVQSLGIKNPEDILNKEISIWNGQINCPVVGVVKDFNDRSFRDKLAPLLISTNITMYNQAAIKLSTNNFPATVQSVKAIWEQTFPEMVFEYKFLDEKIGNFYKQENQLSQLYKIFSAIAIFLSCLGLYGLASFMAVQRVKEVGIRKVLGASAGSIVYLFSKEFIILIGIAFAIATPIAWYYMHQWLQDYVYRINISWWIFAGGGLVAIIIALTTISFRAVRAALANPVKSLRSE